MSRKETVLVTTATGNNGKQVVSQLIKRGFIVKAATRSINSEAARKLAEKGAIVTYMDPNKEETIDKALEGVDKLFFNLSFGEEMVKQGKILCKSLKKSKVKFICKISTMEIGLTDDPVALWHEEQENDMKACGIDYVILRPNGYMQNLNRIFKMPIKNIGAIVSPFGYGKVGYVDCRDIAEVSAETLARSNEFIGKVIYLHGPQVLDHEEVAQIISKVVGRKVAHIMVTGQEFKERVKRFVDVPERTIDLFVEMCDKIVRTNKSAVTNNAIQEILGRPARTLEGYIRDNIDDFTPPLITKPTQIKIAAATVVVAISAGVYYFLYYAKK